MATHVKGTIKKVYINAPKPGKNFTSYNLVLNEVPDTYFSTGSEAFNKAPGSPVEFDYDDTKIYNSPTTGKAYWNIILPKTGGPANIAPLFAQINAKLDIIGANITTILAALNTASGDPKESQGDAPPDEQPDWEEVGQ